MSVWIVSYYCKIGLNLDRTPTIIGVYKSEDDAFKVAVTRDGHYRLSQTLDGAVWMYSIKNLGFEPIEFEKVKKLVRDRKDGYYNHYNPYRSGGWCGDNYTILENKIKTVKISIPKTKIITGKHKCDDCGKTYKSMYSLKISTGKYLHKFYGRNCPACNPYIENPESDRWYLTSEQKNKLPKMKYTGYHLTEYGVVLVSNTTPPFLKGEERIAIGSDKQKDGYLSLLTDEQFDEIDDTSSWEGSIEIDETWRKGNNEPILFSDYLKMTSNVIQDTEGLVMAQAKMKVANKNKIEEIREKTKKNELKSPENNSFSRYLCTCFTNSNFTCRRCKRLHCINCVKLCTSCERFFCSACLILGEYKKYNKCYPCSGRVGFYG